MIVYIESNFILELALQQEQAAAADAILKLAEHKTVDLVLPSFAVSEPFSTLAYRRTGLNRVLDLLTLELNQIQRSIPHQRVGSALNEPLNDLRATSRHDGDALVQATQRILEVARLIHIDSEIFESARVSTDQFGLQPADAVIFATIMADLAQQPRRQKKCFLSRDRRAFLRPDIRKKLSLTGCRIIPSFDDALGFLTGKRA